MFGEGFQWYYNKRTTHSMEFRMGKIFSNNLSDKDWERIFVVQEGKYKNAEINGGVTCDE